MPEQILAGKYVVQSEIAKGGMGIIYKALDRTLNRVVAIKLVHAHLSGDSSFVERFLREARAMARFQHDNIVTIYDAVEDHGTQLLVMEYFQGKNLRELTKNRSRLPLRDIVSITQQLANALAFAHAHGIIHRDIKPANVMVDKRGKAKLTDFGIAAALDEASITSTGQVIGTPEYMSPEQACGTKLDGRSDLYSVGIMLYEMLTGKTPYADASKTSILGKLAFDQQELSLPFPSDVPSMLQGVVRDLLRRQPDDRIPDADTLATQLHEILYTLPASSSVPMSAESNETVVVSPPPAANAKDKGEPESPTVIAPEGRGKTRIEPSMATERTQIPLPASTLPPPAPPYEDETTVLPPQTRKSDSSIKPSSSAPLAQAPSVPSPSSFRLMPLVVGGGVIITLLVGLMFYSSESPQPPPPTDKSTKSETVDPKIAILEAQLKEREEMMSKLEELVHGTAKRLPAERQTSECPALKDLLSETYEKFEDSVRDVNVLRQKLGKEPSSVPPRPSELDLLCEAPKPFSQPIKPKPVPPPPPPPQEQRLKAFPDAQLSSLLEKFKTAYERRDIDTLRALSRFKEGRERNIEVMFSNYTSFEASIQNMRQTDDGATAQLVLDKVVSTTGETVSLPPLSRTFKLQISRQGDVWDKILW
jgi:serine/threonine protein kinase